MKIVNYGSGVNFLNRQKNEKNITLLVDVWNMVHLLPKMFTVDLEVKNEKEKDTRDNHNGTVDSR